jgi:hypothetical protein
MKEILFSQKLDLIEHKQTVYTMNDPLSQHWMIQLPKLRGILSDV